MRENPYFFELLSPTHLTSLPPSVAGIDEIKLCHYLIQAGGVESQDMATRSMRSMIRAFIWCIGRGGL